jgi:hypothetical protein
MSKIRERVTKLVELPEQRLPKECKIEAGIDSDNIPEII